MRAVLTVDMDGGKRTTSDLREYLRRLAAMLEYMRVSSPEDAWPPIGVYDSNDLRVGELRIEEERTEQCPHCGNSREKHASACEFEKFLRLPATACGRCGARNRIVNECRCDPDNLPTRPDDSRAINPERELAVRWQERAQELEASNAEMMEAVRAMRDSVMNLAKRLDSEPGNQVAVAAWMHRIQAVDNAIARVGGRK
jgi:hypothetical protein